MERRQLRKQLAAPHKRSSTGQKPGYIGLIRLNIFAHLSPFISALKDWYSFLNALQMLSTRGMCSPCTCRSAQARSARLSCVIPSQSSPRSARRRISSSRMPMMLGRPGPGTSCSSGAVSVCLVGGDVSRIPSGAFACQPAHRRTRGRRPSLSIVESSRRGSTTGAPGPRSAPIAP